MSNNSFEAKTAIQIKAPLAKVWDALVKPAMIKEYMSGTTVRSDWKEGSPIVWTGEWKGNTYEEKGIILRLIREQVLQYNRYNALSGLADLPENYQTITLALSSKGAMVEVSLTEDNNPDEKAKAYSEKVWQEILGRLKQLLE